MHKNYVQYVFRTSSSKSTITKNYFEYKSSVRNSDFFLKIYIASKLTKYIYSDVKAILCQS